MVNIERYIKSAKARLVVTKFFDCFLDSLVISLLISGILLAFGANFVYSFIFGLGYLGYGFFKAMKQSSLSEIEKKVPNLEWQLRTAADNLGRNDSMVSELNEEVAEKIGFMNFMDFLSGKRTITRVLGMVVLGIFIFYMQSTGANLITVATDLTQEITNENELTGLFGDNEGEFQALASGGSGDEGENIEGNEIELELNSEANKVDLDTEGDLENKKQSGSPFSGVIGGEQDSSFNEQINADEQEIVENFYNNLNKD